MILNTMSLAQRIKEKRSFSENERYFCVDLDLSKEDSDCFHSIQIKKGLEQFNHYGHLNSELEERLALYFSEMGENTDSGIQCIARLVVRIAKGMTIGFETEAAWIMVRVTLPTDVYDLPRWHSDGRYFRASGKAYKLVVALKGLHTRFAEKIDAKKFTELMGRDSKNVRMNLIESNNPVEFKAEDLKIRAEIVKTVREIEINREGQAAVYLVGDENAVIHSEPKMDSPRIFLSVLPGSQKQINEWKTRSRK